MKTSSNVWKMKCDSLSSVRLFAKPWTTAGQAALSMEFSRQEYLSGLPFPSPGDLPNPGFEPGSPTLQADSLPSEPPGKWASNHWLRKSYDQAKLDHRVRCMHYRNALSSSYIPNKISIKITFQMHRRIFHLCNF